VHGEAEREQGGREHARGRDERELVEALEKARGWSSGESGAGQERRIARSRWSDGSRFEGPGKKREPGVGSCDGTGWPAAFARLFEMRRRGDR
jgi:hypothetical protein